MVKKIMGKMDDKEFKIVGEKERVNNRGYPLVKKGPERSELFERYKDKSAEVEKKFGEIKAAQASGDMTPEKEEKINRMKEEAESLAMELEELEAKVSKYIFMGFEAEAKEPYKREFLCECCDDFGKMLQTRQVKLIDGLICMKSDLHGSYKRIRFCPFCGDEF